LNVEFVSEHFNLAADNDITLEGRRSRTVTADNNSSNGAETGCTLPRKFLAFWRSCFD
jgi:hypothetical protein